jgi:hypothetical protein
MAAQPVAAIDEPVAGPHALAAAVERAWQSWLLRSRRPFSAHSTVWASGWRACDRRMAYDLTQPDQQVPFDAATLARFRRGDDRERDLLADAQRIGRDADPPFDIVSQQERFEARGRSGAVVITGKVDARLRFERQSKGAPLEVKAWSPYLVEKITVFEDVMQNEYTRGGGYQLLLYLYGAAEPHGFLLLDRSGIPKLVVVELTDTNLGYIEEFLSKAERVVAHVAAGTLPDYIDDAAECARCPYFGTACNPPLSAKDQQVFTDEALELDLERWWALREPGREWASLDRRLKEKLHGVENGLAGHFAISGTWGKYSRVVLPDDLKAKYTEVDPKGKFSLKVERL